MDPIAESCPDSRATSTPCTSPPVEPQPPKQMGDAEESERARIERLGRQRPEIFRSRWAEAGFCYSVLASQFMAEYFVSGFNVLLPTLIVRLDIPAESAIWPASAFSLVTAAFLLPFGRLADMYGGFPVYMFGLAWFAVWSVVAGFSTTQLMLDFCRALQGLGPSAFLPSGVMLMGSIYRPGPRKNLVFSLYGGSAPLGFFAGIFFAGLTGQFLHFGWYFWIGAILVATTAVSAYLTVPSDAGRTGVQMDWWGSGLIVSGLILVVYAITDSSHAPQGWRTPYIYSLLILGAIVLACAVYVEARVASNPLIPPWLFRVPYLPALVVALFFSYGVLGVFLLYSTLFMQDILGASPLLVTAYFVPMAAGGVVLSVVGGYVLHLISGTGLILVAGLGWMITSLLFALAPGPGATNYWAWIFPAMLCATLGIDLTFNVTNVFISTNLPCRSQGLAGALINSVLYLGIAGLLAFADVVQTATKERGRQRSYQSVFWYQFACAAVSLVIMVAFVRIRAAESELTVDERAALDGAGGAAETEKEGAAETEKEGPR
ncbi:MAG: hypothetical protein M1832_001589 [Thelocarpon impressellum]|nr:MAG: hypothetical protein M1832_001589 [Thelocarpon impressellum]